MMMITSESSNTEGYFSGQEGLTPNNFESRPDVEPTSSLNQYQSSNLFYPHSYYTEPAHRTFSSEDTQEYYAQFHQSPMANEPVVNTTHQPPVSAEGHEVSEVTIQPLGNRVPPRQSTKPHQWNWDTSNHNKQAHLLFQDYDHWPDGNQQRVYSAALKRVKRHQSGWAMRNSNNHNSAILKKSCLGVLVCSNGCVNEDGREICYRPAICHRARRKQCLQMCPIAGCGGQIIQRPCRGNGGYPVTHFWRQEGSAMFFRSKGRHDHPRPMVKLPSSTISVWHRSLPETRTFNPLNPPMETRAGIGPQANSERSNFDASLISRHRLYNHIIFPEALVPPSPCGQREIRPSLAVYRHTTEKERQQFNLPSESSRVEFGTGLLRDTSANHAALSVTEQAFYAPQQEPNFDWGQAFERTDLISSTNAIPLSEPGQIEANNHVSMKYTPDHLQNFILHYENCGIGGAPFASSSIGVVEQNCVAELSSVVQNYEKSHHLFYNNSNSNWPLHSPPGASSISPHFGILSRSVDFATSRACSALQPCVTGDQLQLHGPAQIHNYQPRIMQYLEAFYH